MILMMLLLYYRKISKNPTQNRWQRKAISHFTQTDTSDHDASKIPNSLWKKWKKTKIKTKMIPTQSKIEGQDGVGSPDYEKYKDDGIGVKNNDK